MAFRHTELFKLQSPDLCHGASLRRKVSVFPTHQLGPSVSLARLCSLSSATTPHMPHATTPPRERPIEATPHKDRKFVHFSPDFSFLNQWALKLDMYSCPLYLLYNEFCLVSERSEFHQFVHTRAQSLCMAIRSPGDLTRVPSLCRSF